MSDETFGAIGKRLEEKATAGPWTVEIVAGDELEPESTWIAQIPEALTIATSDGDFPALPDVRLAAFFRNCFPEILALYDAVQEIKRLEREYSPNREPDWEKAYGAMFDAKAHLDAKAREVGR